MVTLFIFESGTILNMVNHGKKSFETFIQKTASCWLWLGRKDKDGYGRFRVTMTKEMRAHRYMFQLTHGAIPEGKFVCHTCDTPSCVNPGHLFTATAKENNDDKIAKGRHRFKRVPGRTWSKLNEKTVAEIRSIQGKTQAEIAHTYGVSQQLISRVLKGEIW